MEITYDEYRAETSQEVRAACNEWVRTARELYG